MSTPEDRGSRQASGVDRLIHEPARYEIMALLYVVERAEFLFVRNQTGMTPGNLSSHLSKLEAAGYVRIHKRFVGKLPRTYLNLTGRGRRAFTDYRRRMKELLTRPLRAPEETDDA
jgi:DNA-binding transcriptional ArsR family regulator